MRPGDRGTPSAAIDSRPTPRQVGVARSDWAYEGRPGVLLTTASYRIFTTAERDILVERLPTFLELALDHYTSALGPLPRPREPMDSYIFANRPQWVRMTQREMGDSAGIYLQIQRGGFAARGRAILYDIGPQDTFAIAAHEGWHQYTQRAFRDPLPTWLEEGVATYMEGFRWSPDGSGRPVFRPWSNLERFETLRRAVRNNRLMTLPELTIASPQDLMGRPGDPALVFYAQVWAAVHFLEEGSGGAYRDEFRRLLADAATGQLSRRIESKFGPRTALIYRTRRVGVDVLEVATGKTAAQLEPEFREFIDRITRVGARTNIAQGRSPLQGLE